MQEKQRKYEFTWDIIGDGFSVARPSLGGTTSIEVYRLFQFTIRDAIEEDYGPDVADKMFRRAGILAGKAFYDKFCSDSLDVNTLVKRVQDLFKDLGIGIFRVESFNPETLEAMFTVDEDLDCAGLPDIDDQICVYDEGFISGILQGFTGKDFTVREVDCWCTGARTCRFSAKPAE